jgi:hypothetical protein
VPPDSGASRSCRAELNYVPWGGTVGAGTERVEVEIEDARRSGLPSWRECGFELVGHRSAVADWTDDHEISRVHYPEVEELARRLTGCDAALVSDHVKRNGADERRQREQVPVRLVHSDFAANYEAVARSVYREVRGRGAETLARNGLSSTDVEAAPRIAVLQFWRNLGAAKMDLPVGFCDGRTVTPADAVPFRYTGYVAGGRSFDALALFAPKRPAAHHWYWYPEMQPDEVVVFRTYDTDLVQADRTWFTPHSAFRDPEVKEGAPPRFSIELRVLCLYST